MPLRTLSFLDSERKNMLPGRAAHGCFLCRSSPSDVKPMGTVIAGAPVWGATAGLKFLASSAACVDVHGSSWPPDVTNSTPHTLWSAPTFSCGANISQALRGCSPGWVNDGLHVGSLH